MLQWVSDLGQKSHVAEGEGFEPSIRHNRMPDFESGAFDHSATLPVIVRGYES